MLVQPKFVDNVWWSVHNSWCDGYRLLGVPMGMSAHDAAALTLPLEVHVFENAGRHYVFDARNFTILRLDPTAAAVARLAATHPLPAIIDVLAGEAEAVTIQRNYLMLLDMIDDGTLSSEPVARPARPPFTHLVVMLAGGCNMGCAYCFEKDVPIYQNPNLMTIARADEVLDWYFRHQEGPSAHIQLYGGEPLLNWSVLEHIVTRAEGWAAAVNKTLTKYLITNGTLLKPERIAFLKAHDVTIQVSVDGDEATHDRFRLFKSGKPTLGVIKPNINELIKQGADFNLRAVMTRENRDPRAIVKGLRRLGAENVSFEVAATDAVEAAFDDDDWETFNETYSDYVNESFSSWGELPDEMKSMILKICQRQRVFYGCGAGVSEVTVSPDGSIYECQRIYREPYSNIAEDRSPRDLGSTLLTIVDDRPICQDCWARYLCGGGCMHQSHIGHGSDDPLPQYCEMKRNLVEATVVRISEIRSQLPVDVT